MSDSTNQINQATLAAGCFWCYEPIFSSLKGVSKVVPGYSGGKQDTADYEDVGTGKTEHAESFQIDFDPSVIAYSELLDIFWHVHDPTTLNQQGVDVGSEYRSAIFYHNEQQKETALKLKQELDNAKEYPNPIVTEISPFKGFFIAEDYHQQYYERHKDSAFSRQVTKPKLDRFKRKYADKLAEEYI